MTELPDEPPALPEGPPWLPPLPETSRSPGPLAARVLGDRGPTVTLIHGLSRSTAFWSRPALAISRHCRVVLIDNPGFGGSRSVPVPWTVEGHAALHLETMEALDAPKPWHLVGLSLGGMISIALAHRATDATASLLVFASSSRESAPLRLSPPCLFRQLGRWLTGRRRERVREFVDPERLATMPELPDEIMALDRSERTSVWPAIRQLIAATPFSVRPHLSGLPDHRRVIVGDRDRLVPTRNSAGLARLLDAPLRVVEGVGHDFSMGAPEIVVDEVWRALHRDRQRA